MTKLESIKVSIVSEQGATMATSVFTHSQSVYALANIWVEDNVPSYEKSYAVRYAAVFADGQVYSSGFSAGNLLCIRDHMSRSLTALASDDSGLIDPLEVRDAHHILENYVF